jgi:hypothetical protein
MRRTSALLALLLIFGLVATGPASSAGSTTYSASLTTAIKDLPGAKEVRTGYQRSKFKHWVDADGDGCNTRQEVLIAESDVQVTVGAGCALTGGRWFSYYDRLTWADSSRIDIDHLVPLAEAWDSGARLWTAAQRQAYANDLGDWRTLVGVTDTVNESKGDQDLAEWQPQFGKCRYLRQWVAVKIRWRLSVDPAERTAMKKLATTCPEATITVKLAK